MNLLNILKTFNDSYRYETKKNYYTISLYSLQLDLFFFELIISIPYWISKESRAEANERLAKFIQELFESRKKEEPKPKRKYVKKEPVKKGPGRPKKK
jgi:hypothetical protein